jgi:hypothetical protein
MSILVLFLSIQQSSHIFTTDYDVSCGFVIYGLYYIKVHSLYIKFVEIVIRDKVEIEQIAFLHLLR